MAGGFWWPQSYIHFFRVDVWFFGRSGSSKRVCWRRPKTERATLVAFHRPSSRRRKTPPCVCVCVCVCLLLGPRCASPPSNWRITNRCQTAQKPSGPLFCIFESFLAISPSGHSSSYASLDIRLLDPKHWPKIFRLSRPKKLLSLY
jgi:hypothetical protein